MPPNRKVVDAVDTLATLNVSQFVDAKYQPLIVPAPSLSQTKPNSKPDAPIATVPLLQEDPVRKAIIDRIIVEERLREQFSADHLIAANRCGEEKTEDVLHREHAEDADDYWDTATPDDVGMIKARRTDPSYWDWRDESKKQDKDDLIQNILKQEKVRELLSIQHVEQKVQEEAAALSKAKQSLLPESDSYWEWNAQVDLNDNDMQPDKALVIQHILEAERLRLQFSVAAIEDKLKQGQKDAGQVSSTIAANDDYWAGF